MYLKNEKYIVNITIDTTYTLSSADNKPYDIIFNPANMKRNDYTKTFCIKVETYEQTKEFALVGEYYCYDDGCAVLEGDILSVLQNKMITQINLSSDSIVFHKVLELIGCSFAIYRKSDFYIVYGELEIVRLNESFEKVWDFSGADIFVTQNGAYPFELLDDRIKLNDWIGNYYEVDFDGNLIKPGSIFISL